MSTSSSVGSPCSRSEAAMATTTGDGALGRTNYQGSQRDDAGSQETAGNRKKKRAQRAVGGDKSGCGLRQCSMKVCKKVESKEQTTYNEVADKIVAEFSDPNNSLASPDQQQQYGEENIRQREYDALNVLVAMDIISKDKKEIKWKGLPQTSLRDIEVLKAEQASLLNELRRTRQSNNPIPEIQLHDIVAELTPEVLSEQGATQRSPLEPQNEDEDDQAGIAERNNESGGSVSGLLRPSEFYETTSNRSRMKPGETKPPPLDELEGDDDLARRFNRKREAYTAYLELEGKRIILDRGFDTNLLQHGLISYMIRTHGWDRFGAHHDEDSNWELIREFYANIDAKTGKTWVRSREIKIDASTLNQFLGTKDEPGKLTFELMNRMIAKLHEKEGLRRIAWSMCSAPPVFLVGPTFDENQVKVEIKPSMDFYFAKVKPISHTHRVSGMNLYGLSEILLGEKVNMGEVIYKTLVSRQKGRQKGKGLLVFPNLIRRLSEQAGVDFSVFNQDRAVKMGGPIPLLEWNSEVEFRYELVPFNSNAPDEIQSVAPPQPPPRARSKKAAPKAKRARTKRKLAKGEERTINQGEIPREGDEQMHKVPGTAVDTQAANFMEFSQTLVTLQEKQIELKEREMKVMLDAQLAQRQLELNAQKEADERRIRAETEREVRMQQFQLQWGSMFLRAIPGANPAVLAEMLNFSPPSCQPTQPQPPKSTLPADQIPNTSQPSSSAPPPNQNQPPPPAPEP